MTDSPNKKKAKQIIDQWESSITGMDPETDRPERDELSMRIESALDEKDAVIRQLVEALEEAAMSSKLICAKGHANLCNCGGDKIRSVLSLPAVREVMEKKP